MNLNQMHGPVISQKKICIYQDGDYKSGTVTICRYSDGTVILDNGKAQSIQRPACLLTRTLVTISTIKKQIRKKVSALFTQVKEAINSPNL